LEPIGLLHNESASWEHRPQRPEQAFTQPVAYIIAVTVFLNNAIDFEASAGDTDVVSSKRLARAL
jgi:hypothetical protein